jgi:uncharacterized protein (TIGR03435 family)
MRIFALTLVFSCLAVAQPKLEFEVVAIRPAPRPTPETVRDGSSWIGTKIEGNRVQIGGSPPMLVSSAFRVPLQQVVFPESLDGFFNIQATLPDGATRDQVPEMLQAMLVERFKLAYHREMRDYSLTFLTVGKDGMKLPRLPDNTPPSSSSTPLPGGGAQMTQVGKVNSLFPVMNSFGGLQMADETGLDGVYSWVRVQQAGRPGMTYQDVVQVAFQDMIE